jgi:glutamate-1-semialdehyde aminotransferase/3-oxoacyl-(acyl-carrier-protein) synthase/NRPS condensation-like uncharacterized protein/aryl carrier-like protein
MDNIDLTKKLYTALKLAESKLIGMEQKQTEAIAIVGMAGRFPDADNLDEFWDNLYKGHDPVREVPAERWNATQFFDENPDTPGKSYCNYGSFLSDIKGFDTSFFNILPAEAKQMDPKQRILLEVTWQALENANIKPSSLYGSDTAVYMGTSDDNYSYFTMGELGKGINPHSVTGNAISTASGRLSYFLGLQGANVILQTACSSSLATVDLGVQELRLGKTNLVIAGGINLMLLPFGHMALSRTRAISADGRCKSFDASADGYGRGEGCGIIILKRYSDALKNGDNILALIKGSAVNQDGASNGMTAPNGLAQDKVIRKALLNANISADEVSFIEAHGTGTKLGDPIEMEVLGNVYSQNRTAENPLYVSSVKSNIGHLEAAAGIASVIKTALSLYHGTIPGNLHFKNPNASIPWKSTICIPTSSIPLKKQEKPYTAAISSFGFSGTNVHIVMESVPQNNNLDSSENDRPLALFLSAKDSSALTLLVQTYQTYLSQTPYSLNDICYTAANHRDHFSERIVVIAKTKADAIQLLNEFNVGGIGKKTIFSNSEPDIESTIFNIASKYIEGCNSDQFASFFVGNAINIPVYQFNHQDYWVESEPYLRLINQEHSSPTDILNNNTDILSVQEDILTYLFRVIGEITELPAEQINASDDFFAIGMDSILLMQLKDKVNRERNVAIEVSAFYDSLNTLEKLAEYLLKQQPNQAIVPESARYFKSTASTSSSSNTFVPYKEVNILQESLDAIKEKSIQQLIANVNKISGTSKSHTQLYRKWLANNRNIAGFRPKWKEMTYQLVAEKGKGAYVWDKEGNRFLDFSMGFGVNLFGYNPEFVQKRLHQMLDEHMVLGALSPLAGELAEAICSVTGNERVAFYNTGTEAVMVAIRLARTITGKNKIVVFAGSYHGTYDGILAREGKGIYADPLAPGVAPSMVQDVIVLHYGSMEDLEIIRDLAPELAAVLVEPIQSRYPEFFPAEFLKELRAITQQNEVALIFDEVISGFRFAINGIRAFTEVRSDITVYGKVIGGGIPVGVVAGNSKYLDAVDGGFWKYGDQSYPTSKSTFVAGTFCHHPLAMAAGLSVLEHLKQNPQLYIQLEDAAEYLCNELNSWFEESKISIRMVHFGSLFRFKLKGNEELLFAKLLSRGIYIWEGRNCYLSTAHTSEDIEFLIISIKESCTELQVEGWINLVEKEKVVVETNSNIFPLSPAQQGVWWAQQLDSNLASFNLSESFLVEGSFNIEIFEKSCIEIIKKHEILRTSFFDKDGVPFQEVHQEFSFAIKPVSLAYLSEEEALIEAQKIVADKIREPFNLEHGPLLNVLLYSIKGNKFVLSVIVHHIVCDGWAMEVFFDELMATYNQLLMKPDSETPLAAYQYRQYVQETLSQTNILALKEYWHNQVQGINTLTLAGDLSAITDTHQESFDEILIAGSDYKNLLTLIKQQNTSSFTALTAITKLLLYSKTGVNDIAIGTPVPGRVQSKWNKLIGHCLNMLVLRSYINEEESFVIYLQKVKSLILNAYERQEYSFETLKNECFNDRSTHDWPFFEIEIAMQNFRLHRHQKGNKFADFQLEIFNNLSLDCRKYPIEFRFDEGHEDILLKVAYDPCRYSQKFIRELLQDWQNLFRHIAQSASMSVSEIINAVNQQKEVSQQHSLKNNRQNNFSKLISTSTIDRN